MSKHTYSLEFFPPKDTEGLARLRETRVELVQLEPEFCSVTYGAGGSTRERTFDAVMEIHRDGVQAAPHLSCVGSTRSQLAEILDTYRNQGITRLVALRGDLPSGARSYGEFRYASDLVAFVREHAGGHFFIEVAAYPEYHPQAASSNADIENFARKVQAGADGAITQYFYNADAYFHFRDRCAARGLDIGIVPGIMPITNFKGLVRFSDICGAEIPRWVRTRLEELQHDPPSLESFGEEVVTGLCQRLLDDGAPGLHFYTMNKASPTLAIWRNLTLPA